MPDHRAPGAVALLGEVAVATRTTAYRLARWASPGRCGAGFFSGRCVAEGGDNGGSHASPHFQRQGDDGRAIAHVAQVRYHLDTPSSAGAASTAPVKVFHCRRGLGSYPGHGGGQRPAAYTVAFFAVLFEPFGVAAVLTAFRLPIIRKSGVRYTSCLPFIGADQVMLKAVCTVRANSGASRV